MLKSADPPDGAQAARARGLNSLWRWRGLVQDDRELWRCHPIMVWILAIMRVDRQSFQTSHSQVQRSRSADVSFGRLFAERWSTRVDGGRLGSPNGERCGYGPETRGRQPARGVRRTWVCGSCGERARSMFSDSSGLTIGTGVERSRGPTPRFAICHRRHEHWKHRSPDYWSLR